VEEAQRFLRLDRYWRQEVVEALLARCDEVVGFDPTLSCELARIADQLVARLRDCPAGLKAHARCALAVALRHLGRLDESALAFDAATTWAATAGLAVQAMVARQRAMLLLNRGDVDGAAELARRAVAADRQRGDRPSVSLIIQGIVFSYQQHFYEAIGCFSEVLTHEDPRRPVYLLAIQNLAACLAESSRTAEEIVRARRILRLVRERIKGVRDTPIRYRVCWAEAILHRRLEEFDDALEVLRRARKGFLRLRMLHDFALISADLATLHLEMEQEKEASALLKQTASRLQTLKSTPLLAAFEQARQISDLRAAVAALQLQLARPFAA
jgi:tetratricopeptide (TPR) repeat protein